MPVQIAPSILSADFLRLGEEIQTLNCAADLVHIDVMDGSFVPNISMGIVVTEAVRRIAKIPLDVHLMVVRPGRWIERFAAAGADYISFHLEAARQSGEDPAELLRSIRAQGCKAGLVINPDIPVEQLYPYLHEADFVLIMSVFAGFSGQKFIPETFDRVRTLKAEIIRQGVECEIEVDGGVSPDNAGALCEAGATMLVAASSIYRHEDRVEGIRALREAAARPQGA